MTLPHRIVLFGVSGSGKSTLGAGLHQNYGFHVTAFADPIKRAAKEIFGFSDEHLFGHSTLRETPYEDFLFSGKCPTCRTLCECRGGPDYWHCPGCGNNYSRYITPRIACQTLGTEWGRQLCTHLWTTACFREMAPHHRYVVTDGRFWSELDASRAQGAFCVLLQRGLDASTSVHQSEAEVRDMGLRPGRFDLVFDNREGSAEDNFDALINAIFAQGELA